MRDRFDSILEYNGLKTPDNLIELNSILGTSSLMNSPETIGMSTISHLKSINFQDSKILEEKSDITLNVGMYWRRDSKKIISDAVVFFQNNISL